MSRGLIKFILNNADRLEEYDKLHLLRQMSEKGIKISEGSNGSRIWLDRLSEASLQGIADYIQGIMDRDQEFMITL